jgi:hypothetical protein
MAWVITGIKRGKPAIYERWAGMSAAERQSLYGMWIRKPSIACIFTKRKEAVQLIDGRTEVYDGDVKITNVKIEQFSIGELEGKPPTGKSPELGERRLKI